MSVYLSKNERKNEKECFLLLFTLGFIRYVQSKRKCILLQDQFKSKIRISTFDVFLYFFLLNSTHTALSELFVLLLIKCYHSKKKENKFSSFFCIVLLLVSLKFFPNYFAAFIFMIESYCMSIAFQKIKKNYSLFIRVAFFLYLYASRFCNSVAFFLHTYIFLQTISSNKKNEFFSDCNKTGKK